MAAAPSAAGCSAAPRPSSSTRRCTSRTCAARQVREITFLGNRCRLSFELDELPGHALLAEVAPEALPHPACELWVALPPHRLQVFA